LRTGCNLLGVILCLATGGCASLPAAWARVDGRQVDPKQLSSDRAICEGEIKANCNQQPNDDLGTNRGRKNRLCRLHGPARLSGCKVGVGECITAWPHQYHPGPCHRRTSNIVYRANKALCCTTLPKGLVAPKIALRETTVALALAAEKFTKPSPTANLTKVPAHFVLNVSGSQSSHFECVPMAKICGCAFIGQAVKN
jgi:hypothetical protein